MEDYSTRSGILPISWEYFHGLCKALAAAAAGFDPQVILAVARGGLYPGALISHLLRRELYPVRLTRRLDDVIVSQRPRWLVEPPAQAVAGKRLLIVDEICDSGETLRLVKEKAAALGAAETRCAVLYAHSRAAAPPNYIGLVSDALLLNPWDREVWEAGEFRFHPEYAAALRQQGREEEAGMRIKAEAVRLAKGG
jgi:hypothetical protein